MSTPNPKVKSKSRVTFSRVDHRVRVGVIGVLVMAAIVAALLWGVTTALAHHPTYTATTTCNGDWTADSTYVGGDSRRLILISVVVVNGQSYDPSWSNAPDTTADSGTPIGTNHVISYDLTQVRSRRRLATIPELPVGVSQAGPSSVSGNPMLPGPAYRHGYGDEGTVLSGFRRHATR